VGGKEFKEWGRKERPDRRSSPPIVLVLVIVLDSMLLVPRDAATRFFKRLSVGFQKRSGRQRSKIDNEHDDDAIGRFTMMSKPNEKKIIVALMKRYGRTFSSEVGIKMGNPTPSALFRWLCASLQSLVFRRRQRSRRNHEIRIRSDATANATAAAKRTVRLNLLIRLSYSSTKRHEVVVDCIAVF
jgi:hypothetical protein